MTKRLSQVGRGPNNIRRGIPYKMAKTYMISLPESTNDLGLALAGSHDCRTARPKEGTDCDRTLFR